VTARIDPASLKALRDYERSRQPWRNEARDREPIPNEGDLWDVRPLGRGPSGATAGRVFHRMNLAAHEETTRQLAGLYPFMAGRGLAADGAYIGRDRHTQAPFVYDPFQLYEQGLLSNPNLALFGVIGSGKSALLKTLALRFCAFGIKFLNPCDTKGEMRGLAEATGAVYVPLGPGLSALSPLYAPPRPPHMSPVQYRERIEQHRMLLLRALGETATGQPLTADQETLIELALREVTRSDGDPDRMRQPSMPELVEVMLSPTPAMKDELPFEILEGKECRDLALRFRSMVKGSLRGVFDGDPVPLDLSKAGLVIDISRIRNSDAAIALTMTCGQAMADLILSFSQDRWLKIFDEAWRQVRYPAIMRRISEGQKLARGDDQTTGSATLLAMHRISDLLGADPAVRELAMGLLADTSTRIVYNQASDQIGPTAEALGLTDIEAAQLPSLGKGSGLWKIGKHSALVDHVVLRDGLEWPLIQTDARMLGEGGAAEYNTVADPATAMARELG